MNCNNIVLPDLNPMQDAQAKKKSHVHVACNNCKKAHLACDESRPCKRCHATDKADSCQNTEHKKRGRPKLLKEENKTKSRRLSVMTPELINSTFSSDANRQDTPQMMTMFITLDLCCARVSEESFEMLDLYPQELSHRSIYDFILPGEEAQIAKIHRHLLNNVTQQHKIPPHTLRSSSDLFYSTPPKRLMDIANGSQTFKQTLKLRRKENEHLEMNASFYLGGGLGADLLEATTLSQLYIVCVLTPTVTQPDAISSLFLLSEKPDEDLLDLFSSSPTNSYASLTNSYHSMDPMGIQEPTSFKDCYQDENKQSLHPNELYYFQTTSSRLCSNAHTTFPYLSTSHLLDTNPSISPLAKFNMSTPFLS
ncbi:hypothetical protein G6F56_003662 [Rhizopus delemar]|nr:hypothetical protein G6F56_003662 [Rhizopus delemar]